MDWGQVALTGGGLVLTFFGGRWTRQSAKESNAGQLYSGLSAAQNTELIRLGTQLREMAEEREKDRHEREQEREASRARNRQHMSWDRALVRKLRVAIPDEEFDDPPPLDV
jgi:hypothetical protein